MNEPAQNPPAGSTWEEAERETLRAGAELSLYEKIQWLEEAERISLRLVHGRVRYRDPAAPDRWLIAESPLAYHVAMKRR